MDVSDSFFPQQSKPVPYRQTFKIKAQICQDKENTKKKKRTQKCSTAEKIYFTTIHIEIKLKNIV